MSPVIRERLINRYRKKAGIIKAGEPLPLFQEVLMNLEAHGGRIQQWTVTRIERDVFVKSEEKDWSWQNCPYHCGDDRRAKLYDVTYADFEVTICYLDDGHEEYSQECGRSELPGTRHTSPSYFYYIHYKTNSISCSGN